MYQDKFHDYRRNDITEETKIQITDNKFKIQMHLLLSFDHHAFHSHKKTTLCPLFSKLSFKHHLDTLLYSEKQPFCTSITGAC